MSLNLERDSLPLLTKPGLHSYNVSRKAYRRLPARRGLAGWLSIFFLVIGLAALAYYGYTLGDQHLYQAYENWAFNQEIAGRRVTFKDWVMQSTPLGGWVGYQAPSPALPAVLARNAVAEGAAVPPVLNEGDLLGRIEIPRLHLAAIVRQGVDQETLSRAVGHVPSTQAPGAVGNFAIAAHRDTLFRALKDIQLGDTVEFQSPRDKFDYQVISTQIVRPTDVSVLRPQGNQRLLTMITCYPFYFVGSAPKRFIVTARLVSRWQASSGTQAARSGEQASP